MGKAKQKKITPAQAIDKISARVKKTKENIIGYMDNGIPDKIHDRVVAAASFYKGGWNRLKADYQSNRVIHFNDLVQRSNLPASDIKEYLDKGMGLDANGIRCLESSTPGGKNNLLNQREALLEEAEAALDL